MMAAELGVDDTQRHDQAHRCLQDWPQTWQQEIADNQA